MAGRQDCEGHTCSSLWWELLFLGLHGVKPLSWGQALVAESRAGFKPKCGCGFEEGCSALGDVRSLDQERGDPGVVCGSFPLLGTVLDLESLQGEGKG